MRTLSACRKQSIRLILPFWSGFDRTHMAGFFPVIESTKSSRHSWAMSFRSFPRSREAHFCFTSGFSACKASKDQSRKIPHCMYLAIFSQQNGQDLLPNYLVNSFRLSNSRKLPKQKGGQKFMSKGWKFFKFLFNLLTAEIVKR